MRFGVREICNVVFKAADKRKIGSKVFEKGQPVILFDSLKTSTMEQATTTVYAQGGRGNTRLVAWEGEKTLTFTMEDALISEMGLAILAGANLYEAGADKEVGGNTLLVHVTETTATGTVTKKPTTNDKVKAYALELDDNGDVVDMPTLVTIATTEEKDGAGYKVTTLDANKIYIIDYYTEVATKAYQIDIEPQSFGGNFYIEADTLFRDTKGTDHAAQFIIPNGKIQSNFTLTMASSGDPSTFTFTVDAFPGYVNGDLTKKVMASIQIVEEDTTAVSIKDAAGDIDDATITD
jgi:hypothetical protein